MSEEPLTSDVRCCACGCVLLVPAGQLPICAYHISDMGDWAKENAIWCHFIHRKMPLPRLSKEERSSNDYTVSGIG